MNNKRNSTKISQISESCVLSYEEQGPTMYKLKILTAVIGVSFV